MKLTTLFTLAALTILAIACTAAPQQLVGNDRDSHGCIPSAGYSWCDAKQKCLRVWEEPCETPANETAQGAPSPMPGSDRDSHGCIPSAGYSWCEAKQQCIRPWEENCTTPAANGTAASCTCPDGYVQEGNACNPKCYYSTPKCLMPSVMCTPTKTGASNPLGHTSVRNSAGTNSTTPTGMG
jgi:hypothetical protein